MIKLVQWIFILLLSSLMLIYTTSTNAYYLFVFYVTIVPMLLLVHYGFDGLGIIDNMNKFAFVIAFYEVIPISIIIFNVKYIFIVSFVGFVIYCHYVLLVWLLLFTFKKWFNIN